MPQRMKEHHLPTTVGTKALSWKLRRMQKLRESMGCGDGVTQQEDPEFKTRLCYSVRPCHKVKHNRSEKRKQELVHISKGQNQI